MALDDATEGDDRHLGRAAADVDDHAAGGLHNRQTRADRRRHGLLNQIGLAGAGVESRVVHGALFYLCHAAGDADDDARPRYTEAVAFVHGADEVVQHPLRDVEIGDDAVL